MKIKLTKCQSKIEAIGKSQEHIQSGPLADLQHQMRKKCIHELIIIYKNTNGKLNEQHFSQANSHLI